MTKKRVFSPEAVNKRDISDWILVKLKMMVFLHHVPRLTPLTKDMVLTNLPRDLFDAHSGFTGLADVA